MKCPYDDKVVQAWFTKQKDHILWVNTNMGQPIMAGLFEKQDQTDYVWIEKHTNREIPGHTITHYMVIPD